MTPLAADRSQLERFVDALFARADLDTFVNMRCFRDDIDGAWLRDEWRAVRVTGNADDLIDQAEDLATLAALDDVPVVFAPPICTFKATNKADEGNVANGLVITAELDGNPAAGRVRLEAVLGPATIALESGGLWLDSETGELLPKIHLHWRLDTPTCSAIDHDFLKEANRLASTLAGGDPTAVPLVHPLRWAGSWHRKAEPRLARIIDYDITCEISLTDGLNKLRAANGRDPAPPKAFTAYPQTELLDITNALACIPNNDSDVPEGASWKQWNDIGLRIYAATNGGDVGLILWLDWSRRSAKFDEANTRERWRHYGAPPPTRTNAGALFNLVRQYWPGFVRPSAVRRQAQFDASAAEFDNEPQPPPLDEDPVVFVLVVIEAAAAIEAISAELGEAAATVIRVVKGERHKAADAGIVAMDKAGTPFYVRDRKLVRICRLKAKTSDGKIIFIPGIDTVAPAILDRALGQAALWERFNARSRDWLRIDPPNDVVSQIISMIGEWPFPPLRGIISCPTLRRDGSLFDNEGYDDKTGLVLYSNVPVPPNPQAPSRADAVAAISRLVDLLEEFPFADQASLSAALSMLLTPVLRGAMDVAPVHLSTAPQAGTGKSYLADVSSAISVGERAAVIAAGSKPEEMEKRLISHALSGFPIFSIDNLQELPQGDVLCQLTERPLLELRALGKSPMHRVDNTFTIFSNGNNAAVVDDLVRRTIRCALDANVEVPEKRVFKGAPFKTVIRDRGQYVADCLIVGRAYIAAGKPGLLPPLASYEDWSDIVRSPLVWLGYADPVNTMESARVADPVRQDRAVLFDAWNKELGITDAYTAAEIVERAEATYSDGGKLICPDLNAFLLGACHKHGMPTRIEPRRLGRWLARNENTVTNGLKLTADRSDAHRIRYRLQCLS